MNYSHLKTNTKAQSTSKNPLKPSNYDFKSLETSLTPRSKSRI